MLDIIHYYCYVVVFKIICNKIYYRGGIMKSFSSFVVKYKKIILIISLLLIIPSVICFKLTKTNYDILVYLPDDI